MSTSETTPNTELVSLSEIVKNNLFKIPDYQRGYSWEKKQLEDLRKDIENLFSKEHMHFTGTIVATIIEKNKYHVVDGQQRLTTLIILLNEACKKLDNSSELKQLFVERGTVGNEKFVLETNMETALYFKNQILKNLGVLPELMSHHRLAFAQKFFKKWFSEKDISVEKVIETVTQKLGFIFFTPQNSKEIGIMFEVINNRGKRLSELEKIKNYFIYWSSHYEVETFREEINEVWGQILRNLSFAGINSNEDENGFLRNCYIVYFEASKSKSWAVYDSLKELFIIGKLTPQKMQDDYEDMRDFVLFLKDASLYYAYLLHPTHFKDNYIGEFKPELIQVLKRLRCQNTIASVLPLFLATMKNLEKETMKSLEILQLIEIVNFRVYILPKITSRADSKQGFMFELANDFYWDIDWSSTSQEEEVFTSFGNHKVVGDNFEWCKLELIGFAQAFCPEAKFVQSLTLDNDEFDDYFYWKGIRYFLASYEEYKQNKINTTFDIEEILKKRKDVTVKKNDFLSLEHIWATANREKYFGKNHKEKRRLGNFVLLGLSKNIQLSNDDIQLKIAELTNNDIDKGFGHMALQQVTVLPNLLEDAIKFVEGTIGHKKKTENYFMLLSAYVNDQREIDMVKFALERWKLPNETLDRFMKVDSFTDTERPDEIHYARQNTNYFLRTNE